MPNSLTGRTHRVNISTVRDHIHLMLLPVLLLLLCSLILILNHHTYLWLKMGKWDFYWNHVTKYGREGMSLPLFSRPSVLSVTKAASVCLFIIPSTHPRCTEIPLKSLHPVSINLELLSQPSFHWPIHETRVVEWWATEAWSHFKLY